MQQQKSQEEIIGLITRRVDSVTVNRSELEVH